MPDTTKLTAHIRWMIRRDMPEVLAIEEDCFGPFAWQEENFINSLRQRNCIGMVAECDDKIVGYMLYELHHKRLVIKNFAVTEGCQREGIGTQMVEKLKGKLTQQRRRHITLEVRETNLGAQLFFRSMGFRATGVLQDHYDECKEDAYCFEYRLAAALIETKTSL